MEASMAAGAGQQDAQGASSGEQQGGPDLSQMMDTLSKVSTGQEEIRQWMQSQQQQGQQEAQQQEAAPPELDLAGLFGEEPDPYGGIDPQDFAAKLAPAIQNLVSQGIEQGVAPVSQQMQEMQMAHRATALATEFPDLQDPEIATQVVDTSRQLASQLGHPELANNVDFWRLTYMAGRASQMHQEDGGESPSAAHLEGGAGARPGAQQVDPVAGMFANTGPERGRRALPFS